MTALPDRPAAAYLACAREVMRQCDELATISLRPDAIHRSYLTPEHATCNDIVAGWMERAGLRSWQDPAGNVCGRWAAEDPAAPVLLVGSHLDTVPDAGRYDGILGVVLAIETLALCRARGERFPFHVDVLGFGDEEGVRFGTTLLGSRAVAGTWEPAWLELEDRQGSSLASALEAFGCEPARIAAASRAGDPLLAYLEVHIEQGPVLEDRGQPLGVVPSIAGARRFEVTISGRAGHAGTVPMAMRQDALVAAAAAIQAVERVARHREILATVGQLHCYPGAPNVIPGECRFSVDVRAGRDSLRDLAVRDLQGELAQLVAARGMRVAWRQTHSAPAVACSSALQRLWERAIIDAGHEPVSIVSGAGHDAMSLAAITEVSMMFVRCAGGISHDPAESVLLEDVAAASAALHRMLQLLADHDPVTARGAPRGRGDV